MARRGGESCGPDGAAWMVVGAFSERRKAVDVFQSGIALTSEASRSVEYNRRAMYRFATAGTMGRPGEEGNGVRVLWRCPEHVSGIPIRLITR